MNHGRQIVCSFSGPNSGLEITKKLEKLENLYLKEFGKKIPVELYLGDRGGKNKPIFVVTAYYDTKDKEQVGAVNFLTNCAKNI